jgi:NAD(P)-dependent dehydrogenase (short-subunit alcohol dehydrogenase family)
LERVADRERCPLDRSDDGQELSGWVQPRGGGVAAAGVDRSLGSMAGGIGLVGGAAYGATKASLAAMTRAWAAEYSASGVRVNAIAPGPVYTPTPSGPEFITALGETTPMHRASQPEEIAEVVAFLASPRASYITGATVAADGGRTAI